MLDFAALPTTAYDLLTWDWSRLEPYYHDLQTRDLQPETLDSWLDDWACLGKLFDESYWRLWVDTTLDTTDTAAEQRFNTFLENLQTPAKAADQPLKQKLLDSGLHPAHFAVPLRNLRTEADLFRAENLPLLNREQALSADYDRIKSLQTVGWDGREQTLVELYPLQLERVMHFSK